MNDIAKLLPKVREQVLRARARGWTSIGLSHLVSTVTPIEDQFHRTWTYTKGVPSANARKKHTSGCPKTMRGKVQRCLTFLAVSGVVFSRTKPEPGVARYEHGETDKHFRIRYTQAQAIEALARLGITETKTEYGSAHWTPSLGKDTEIRQIKVTG